MIERRRGVSDTKFSIALAVIGLGVIVVGMGFTGVLANQQSTIQSSQAQVQALEKTVSDLNSTSGAPSQSGGAYTLTLVVANNQNQSFNSTLGPMPQYYVLGPNGLESSASISVPANTLVKLVIVNYDDGGTNVSPALATVSGTVGNSMLVFNGTSATATSLSVHSVPVNGTLAHTFSIPSLGVNIPVPSSSIVVAYVRFGNAGTYTWDCFSPCMPWANMSSEKGWMTGAFNVV